MEETPLELSLVVVDPDLTESRLDGLTREMTRELNREREMRARLAEGSAEAGSRGGSTEAGSRGDPAAVGAIVLQLLGSGGAIAVLLNGLKAYFLRKQSLVIDVKRPDGMKFTLKAENVSESHLTQTTNQLLEFLKG